MFVCNSRRSCFGSSRNLSFLVLCLHLSCIDLVSFALVSSYLFETVVVVVVVVVDFIFIPSQRSFGFFEGGPCVVRCFQLSPLVESFLFLFDRLDASLSLLDLFLYQSRRSCFGGSRHLYFLVLCLRLICISLVCFVSVYILPLRTRLRGFYLHPISAVVRLFEGGPCVVRCFRLSPLVESFSFGLLSSSIAVKKEEQSPSPRSKICSR